MGVQMTDAVLQLFRHRFNLRRSKAKREHFPNIRHYETHLIDLLQVLVLANHKVDIFPNWSNSCDYIPTRETFGTVPLCSEALHAAATKIKIKEGVTLSAEKQYLAAQMNLPIPFLPVITKEERLRFNKEFAKQKSFDADQMAIRWCSYVDCVNIYPKLPVHLSLYMETFLRNFKIKEAEKKARSAVELLEFINEEHGSGDEDETQPIPPVLMHSPLARAQGSAQNDAQVYVAGNHIGFNRVQEKQVHRRARDKKKRQGRRCKTCLANSESNESARQCPGSSGATAALCKYA
jgi:hypothetical protein